MTQDLKEEMLKLLNFCLEQDYYLEDGKFWKDAFAGGKPLTPVEVIEAFEKDFKEWWEREPRPKYVKSACVSGAVNVYKEGVDFTYSKDGGHMAFNKGGGLLSHWAVPATKEEYINRENK